MAFPQFRRLPTEIRLEIWRYCLPNRVVELDTPVAHLIALSPEDADYCCVSDHTALINRRPPVISRVCSESRMVALEHVHLPTAVAQSATPGMDTLPVCDAPDMVALRHETSPVEHAQSVPLDFDFGTCLGPEDWVDKLRDVLHLNYNASYDAEYPEGEGVFDTLLCESAAKARDASLTCDFYYQLTNKQEYMDTLRDRWLLVCLGIVTIHAPLRPALESGLFGLLGDARVVLVNADDMERKKRYRSFWEKHGLASDVDPHPASFFDRFCQPSTNACTAGDTQDMRFAWLLQMWYLHKDRVADPEQAWVKTPADGYDHGQERWYWQRWIPNQEHPWMKETLGAMPKIRPTIMIRLCTQVCPREYTSGGRPRR